MSNNFHYEIGPLSKYKEHKEKMRNLVRTVKKEKNITIINDNIPPDEWFKIYYANVVFDGDELVGFSLTTECEEFLTDPHWIDFKLWLIKNNYDINKIGANFAYYIDPDYWKKGITQNLVRQSFYNNNYDYFLSFKFATKEFQEWFEKTFSHEFELIDTGFNCQNNTKTFLSKVNSRGIK